MEKDKIPFEAHLCYTIEEAAEVFHLGCPKIRGLVKNNPGARWCTWNGNRPLIIRNEFERFLINNTSI